MHRQRGIDSAGPDVSVANRLPIAVRNPYAHFGHALGAWSVALECPAQKSSEMRGSFDEPVMRPLAASCEFRP